LYPEEHRHHVQGDILKILSNTINNSQSHIFLYKVRSRAGIGGNELKNLINGDLALKLPNTVPD